jgi:hypothetical protein
MPRFLEKFNMNSNQYIQAVDFTADGNAKSLAIGFNPVKVEIHRLDTGSSIVAIKGATKAKKVVPGGSAGVVSFIDNPVTFGSDNTITVGTDADVNVSAKAIKVLAYRN